MAFGTFATQNYATPPAIGATTPAAGSFTSLSASATATFADNGTWGSAGISNVTFLTVNGGSITGASNGSFALIEGTWNTTGIVDAALKVNVTNTASGAGSNLFDLQVGGNSQFYVTKTGNINVAAGAQYYINGTAALSSTTLGAGVVNSSLTGVGTVTVGTWNAGTIGVAYGGTGAATLTAHGPLIGEGTSAIAAATPGTAGQIFTGNGSTSDPSFSSNIALPPGGTAKLNASYLYNVGTNSAAITNNNTGQMAGFGQSVNNNWVFTPKINGNIKITMTGIFNGSLAADLIVTYGAYADTAVIPAPALNAAATGTPFTGNNGFNVAVNGGQVPIVLFAVLTGLTVGHTYRFDFVCYVYTGTGTVTIYHPTVLIEEIFG